jgi:hypothetical protein
MTTRYLAALLLAAALTGCVDNNASVLISAPCLPPVPNDDGSCSYPATCDTVLMGNLWVDTAFAPTGGTLEWPFQIDNQRPNNGERDGGTNTATAFITGYDLSYFSSTVSIPDASVIWTTHTVQPATSQVVSIPVIPPAVATLLGATPGLLAELRVEVRATGYYADGQSIKTGPFSVVVSVENGRGRGGYCPDPAAPLIIGQCPQPGQTSITLCQ